MISPRTDPLTPDAVRLGALADALDADGHADLATCVRRAAALVEPACANAAPEDGLGSPGPYDYSPVRL